MVLRHETYLYTVERSSALCYERLGCGHSRVVRAHEIEPRHSLKPKKAIFGPLRFPVKLQIPNDNENVGLNDFKFII